MAQQDQSFGKYKLLARLAQEPTAEVFKAQNAETNQIVILRLIHAAISAHPQVTRLFDERGDIERYQVEHPNLLSLVDYGEVGSRKFICLECAEGKSLARRVQEGKISVEEATDILRQAAEGLRALHQRRFYHGDLKPANIILTTDRRGRLLVKISLVDLSVASAEATVSIFGELVGTPKYLSPEQIKGERPSAQTDVFALGIIAYEMLAGEPPHLSDTALGYLYKNVHEQERLLREQNSTLPLEISLIVHRMMAKNPQERYRSCQNLLDDLDRAERSVVGGYVARLEPGIDSAFAPRPSLVAPEEVEAPLSKRKTVAVALAVIGVGLCIVGLVSLGLRLFRPSAKEGAPAAAAQESVGERREGEAYKAQLRARAAESRGDVKTAQKEYQALASKYAGTAAAQDAQAKLAELSKPAGKAPAVAPSAELQMTYDTLHSEAQRLIARNEFPLAAKRYEGFILAHEGTPEADLAKERLPGVLTAWADALARGGQEPQAIGKYVEIQEKYKDTEWAEKAKRALPNVVLNHAKRLERAQDFEGALKDYRNLAENYQDTEAGQTAFGKVPEVMLESAKKALTRSDHDGAVQTLKDLVDKHPGTPSSEAAAKLMPDALVQKADALVVAGRPAEAEPVLREVLEKHAGAEAAAGAGERLARLLFASSQGLIKAGKVQEGVAKFEELARLSPKSPLVAEHKTEMDDWKALAARAKAGGVAKSGPELLHDAATELLVQGKSEEALARLDRIVRDFPDTPWAGKAKDTMAKATYDEAVHLKSVGRTRESLSLMSELVSRFPDTEWGRKAADEKKLLESVPEGMVMVPAGPFIVGSGEPEVRAFALVEEEADSEKMKAVMMCETPRHEATAAAFFIDKTEVTNDQYLKFVQETGHASPSGWPRGRVLPGKEDHPVVGVTWEDAAAYARWVGKRLPTEEEWERAARGTDGRTYPWGKRFDAAKCNFMNPEQKATMSVGSFPDSASPAGCLDMIGNAAEWTATWFQPYPSNKSPQPEYGQTHRVVRGGAWNDSMTVYGRCASRRPVEPETKDRGIGFRCAMDARGTAQ